MSLIEYSRLKVVMPSPVGEMWVTVASSAAGVVWLSLDASRKSEEVIEELKNTFSGSQLVERTNEFHRAAKRFLEGNESVEVALDLRGTPFQHRVWSELRSIPKGETITYRDLAERLGMPSAARAVGNAVAANKVAVLVPCHRVVPSSGGAGKFRWGDDIKKLLIESEGVSEI